MTARPDGTRVVLITGWDNGIERAALSHWGILKLNLNTVVWKRVLVQALTPTDAVVSITREGSGRGPSTYSSPRSSSAAMVGAEIMPRSATTQTRPMAKRLRRRSMTG